jgi:transposase
MHSLCNAHHIRELIFVHEQEGQKWAQDMINCLLDIKESVEKEKIHGNLIDESLMQNYERKYKEILREGFKINPLPEDDMVKKRGRKKKTKTLNLLIRLRDYQNETLRFMYNLDVPFDNNLAERDIRMIKVQQKISGLFRTMIGAEQFCRIRSFISTVKKQGLNVIDAIYQIMKGKQIYLEFNC